MYGVGGDLGCRALGSDLASRNHGHEKDGMFDHSHQLAGGPGRFFKRQIAAGLQLVQGGDQRAGEIPLGLFEKGDGHGFKSRALGHDQTEYGLNEGIAHEIDVGREEAEKPLLRRPGAVLNG